MLIFLGLQLLDGFERTKRQQAHQRIVWDILLICTKADLPGLSWLEMAFYSRCQSKVLIILYMLNGNIVDRMNQRLPWQVWRNKKSKQEMLGLVWVGRDPMKNNLLKPPEPRKVIICLCKLLSSGCMRKTLLSFLLRRKDDFPRWLEKGNIWKHIAFQKEGEPRRIDFRSSKGHLEQSCPQLGQL